MRKLLFALSITLGLTTTANAETWSCAYLFQGSAQNAIWVRQGTTFYSQSNKATSQIIFEDNDIIALANTTSPQRPNYFATLFDKNKKMFAKIGLQIGYHSQLIEGECEVF